eukprot:Protomagalhaensia_sp_Gyna_25__5402@NODE_6_length_9172_cov_212_725172_g5_i0_p3_GENE_NODE_6_length_9172_cov_212_725172_g5_i0NODE_6_length_9172_cov_212_725172_g5_i0_p3_ORF_typecomplete_len460_score39_99_NODE_6_length_9172_cov_212_725172_g5_i071148493
MSTTSFAKSWLTEQTASSRRVKLQQPFLKMIGSPPSSTTRALLLIVCDLPNSCNKKSAYMKLVPFLSFHFVLQCRATSTAARVVPWLHHRTPYPCPTNLLFGVIAMPSAIERWTLAYHRLRNCPVVLMQETYNGTDMMDLADFLPLDELETIMGRLDTLPPPSSTVARRHQLKSILVGASRSKRERYLYHTRRLLYRKGQGTEGELALFAATQLLLWKLQQIRMESPQYASPCIITFEDDPVPQIAHLHPQSLDALCLGGDADAWQLFWHRTRLLKYTRLARQNPVEYNSDGVVMRRRYWGSVAMMWNASSLDTTRLNEMGFDADDPAHPFLRCTRSSCIADHFAVRLAVPVTPFVSTNVISTSLLHRSKAEEQFVALRAHWSAYYLYETQSLGAVAGYAKEPTLLAEEPERSMALRTFQSEGFKSLARAISAPLGLVSFASFNATSRKPTLLNAIYVQ